MNADQFLDHLKPVLRRRRQAYGEPEEHFEFVARRWSQILGAKVTPQQVLMCLLDVKVARLIHDPSNTDSLTDLAGYAALLEELRA